MTNEKIYIGGRDIELMSKDELIGVVRGLWFSYHVARPVLVAAAPVKGE